MSTPAPEPTNDLANRVFSNFWFSLAWIIFLAVILRFVWPLRDALLVWWVYGREAYFRHGIRVLKGKPLRFSNGELVPNFYDYATGALAFILVVFGLSMVLSFALRLYERNRGRSTA